MEPLTLFVAIVALLCITWKIKMVFLFLLQNSLAFFFKSIMLVFLMQMRQEWNSWPCILASGGHTPRGCFQCHEYVVLSPSLQHQGNVHHCWTKPFMICVRPAYNHSRFQYGKTFRFLEGLQPIIFSNESSSVHYILADNFDNYNRYAEVKRFDTLFGKGIFNSNGSTWKAHRL